MLEYKDNQLLNRKNNPNQQHPKDNIKANEIFISDEGAIAI